jgi:uncharacterized protein
MRGASLGRTVLGYVLLAALLYLLLCLAVFLLQAKLIYFPGPPPTLAPSSIGLPFEDLRLTSSDGVTMHAWYVPAEPPQANGGAVLFCHGNAGNIEHRLTGAQVFHEMGLAVLLFDYRGYGSSTGSPSEEGTYRDAEAAYDHLAQKGSFGRERIVVYGESLGAAVALELALRRPVAAVIAESAFTSLADIGAKAYPFLPVRLLARYRYDNLAKVPRIGVPLLAIHSPDDEIVPFAQGHRLFEAAREPKQFLRTSHGHNDGGFLLSPASIASVREFIASALPR